MPLLCPTCSRLNPPDAAYCYYDGRGLTQESLSGPLGLGTLPFPMPFSFADGQGCANFNQLVLACHNHWSEARSYLANGSWKTFFTAIGRMDLAVLATPAVDQTDSDAALGNLLIRLPADIEALRPPKLTLPATEEDLGVIEREMDYKVAVVIVNQGMLLLRGSATTDCDWLVFGDGQGTAATKLFQTRDTCTLSVRVVGSKLRASKQPLEGQIVIDTNGGRQTVTVRALVPIRPFPDAPAGNVLAGALSSREIAARARARPQEAAALFEQGAVKAWYARHGWAYPIRGTQARGKGALQQFFEALGLTRPPQLQIDTERIVCEGEVGKQMTKKVIVRTAEARVVYAEAFSNEEWITVLPAQAHGNSVTLPVRIQVPPRPGETLNALVTFVGNGQQQFIVPVTLTVTYDPVAVEKEKAARERWMWCVAGGVVLLALVIAILLVVNHRRSRLAASVENKSALIVEIDEASADVYVDGSPRTVTWEMDMHGMRAELPMNPGAHQVEIKKNGITLATEDMHLQEGERRILMARVAARVPSSGTALKPVPGPARVTPAPAPPGAEPGPAKENERPALLDCTKKGGVPAARMHKAQAAWAHYLGCPVEETVAIGKGVKMTFILIPPGKFRMGSSRAEQDYVTETFYDGKRPTWLDEEGLHVVTLTEPFYLGKYEVTQAQYRALTGKNPSQLKGRRLPVENVSWEEARAYAAQLTEKHGNNAVYRLPTEAEWEYACRGGRPAAQPFGIKDGLSLSSYDANFDGSHPYGAAEKGPSLQRPCAVGSYTANALGLHDLHGNVWEWCSDWYGPYPQEPVTNPSGPLQGSDRVIRGGCWDQGADTARSANRTWSEPDNRIGSLGFRLAHSVPSTGK